MIADSHKEPLAELQTLAQAHRQSVLISGPSGSGKSYLCQQYANMLGIDDFVSIEPKVSDIREAMDRK